MPTLLLIIYAICATKIFLELKEDARTLLRDSLGKYWWAITLLKVPFIAIKRAMEVAPKYIDIALSKMNAYFIKEEAKKHNPEKDTE